jgi:hypothetical protein
LTRGGMIITITIIWRRWKRQREEKENKISAIPYLLH